jgi:peroxiredoxin
MSENKTSPQKSPVSIVLIVILCAVNLLLIRQNLHLRKQLAAGGRTIDLTTNFLQPGDVVTSVTATDLGGHPYQLDYKKDGRQRLLLFFSPTCPYCQQQSPLWRDLLNKVDNNRFTVIGVVSDREDKQLVSEYADAAGYFKTKTPLPLVLFNSESLGNYKLTATPTTLLIDDDGRVEHAWIGKWDEAKAMEVVAALK